MTILELFNEQLGTSNIVLTSDQKTSSLSTICSVFFSVVKPIYSIPTNLELLEGYEDSTNELGLDIGIFIVDSVIQMTNKTMIKVIPKKDNIDEFVLHNSLVSDFLLTCDIVLRNIDKDNLNMLRGSGIDSIESMEVLSVIELREKLSSSHSVEPSSVVM